MTGLDRVSVDGLSDYEVGAFRRLQKTLQDTKSRNDMLSAYFEGESGLRSLGITLPASLKRTRGVLGWPERAVTALNNRCVLDGFRAPGDLDAMGLASLLDANRFDVEFPQASLSSLIHGVSFLAVTRGGVGEPDAIVSAKDALSGAGKWNARKRVLDEFLSILAVDEDNNATGFALYLPNSTVTSEKIDGKWRVTDRSSHKLGVPVEPLVHQARLDKPFGSSRITRSIRESNDRALRAVLRAEVTAEFYSVPQRVLLGADADVFQGTDGQSLSAWQARLLSVWAIPDDDEVEGSLARADVKEFSAAPQTPHLEQLRVEAQLFSGLSDIPVGELGITNDANPTSADSYLASREPLIAKAERTTDGWSPAVRRTVQRALATVNGWDMDALPAEVAGMSVKWRPPKYESRAAAADAGQKQLAAVPWLAETRVGLELLGLTPEQIDEALTDKRRAQGAQALVAAMQAGQAVTGGGNA